MTSFAHDQDVTSRVNQFLEEYKDEVRMLERIAEKYGLPGPRPPVTNYNASGNSEVVRDSEITGTLYTFMRLNLIQLTFALRNVYSSRNAANLLIELVRNAIDRTNRFIKWAKSRGWLDMPPLYRSVQTNITAKIATNEVFFLWDNLVFRYNFLRMVRFFGPFVTDGDLKKYLDGLIGYMEKRRAELEKKMLFFGITLPRPYTPVVISAEQTNTLDDSFIYSVLLRDFQKSVIFYVGGISELLVNDDIRTFVINMAFDEISQTSEMAWFGESKAFISPSPVYQLARV